MTTQELQAMQCTKVRRKYYRVEEVDAVLEKVAAALTQLHAQLATQQSELEALQKQYDKVNAELAQYRADESAIARTLISVRKMADRQQKALAEAEAVAALSPKSKEEILLILQKVLT